MTVTLDDVVAQKSDTTFRLATLQAIGVTDRPARLERLRALVGDQTDGLMTFAERNRVAPVVAHALLDAFPDVDAPAEQRAGWEQVHESSLRRMKSMLGQLDLIGEHLAAEGMPMVALKN